MILPKPILLSRQQIDARAWDNHIHHSRQCVIYALSWYLDTVCEQWSALVWPSATNFSIVMPLPVRCRFGQRIVYQPLFCQYLGIFSRRDLTQAQCGALLEALKVHFPYISSYAFNPENAAVARKLGLKGFQIEVFRTHWLRLNRPYTELVKGYSKDRRVNLKQGLKTDWETIESADFDPLIKLFAENHAAGVGKIQADAYQTLTELGAALIKNTTSRLIYARKGSQVHAGIVLARYCGRVIYLFNAADKTGRKGNARTVMLDAYFRGNAGTELIFDFESPSKESIAGYYAGFGVTEMSFYRIRRNALPFPIGQIQEFRRWLLIKTRLYLSAALCKISNPFPKTRF